MNFPRPEPIRVEGSTHVYTTQQIDDYGFPQLWNVYDYYVTSDLDYERPMTTDWKYEQYLRGTLRPIHRYSRLKRFESTLYQLLGLRGDVDLQVIVDIKNFGFNRDPRYIWDSIRRILKHLKLRKYYNRIPIIIQMLGLPYRIKTQNFEEIINDFRIVDTAFNSLITNRKYFPNLRFVTLKMLEVHGTRFDFYIPLIRTPRKLKPLEELWIKLLESLPKIK